MNVVFLCTDEQLALTKADCTKCKNREVTDNRSVCTVKHIDCSVRKGQRPCSHFIAVCNEPKLKKFKVLLTACAIQEVYALNEKDAAKKADWCSADIEDWEVSEVEQV